MKEREITHTEILESINRSFSAVITRFDERFDGLEGRMDGLEEKSTGLEARFDGLQGRFDSLEKRMDTVIQDLRSFKFDTVMHFNSLESDLKSFKLETQENFSQVNEKLDDLYDTDRGYDRRLSVLEEKAFA